MDLYDRFIGRWEAEAKAFLPDGSTRRHYWQIRFESVLEGRAIQDVWITPPREGPHVGWTVNAPDAAGQSYRAVLAALGLVQDESGGFGQPVAPALWLYPKEDSASSGTHVAFQAKNRTAVARFHAARIKSGGKDNGK